MHQDAQSSAIPDGCMQQTHPVGQSAVPNTCALFWLLHSICLCKQTNTQTKTNTHNPTPAHGAHPTPSSSATARTPSSWWLPQWEPHAPTRPNSLCPWLWAQQLCGAGYIQSPGLLPPRCSPVPCRVSHCPPLLAAAGQPTHCYFWDLAQEDAPTTDTRPWGGGDGQRGEKEGEEESVKNAQPKAGREGLREPRHQPGGLQRRREREMVVGNSGRKRPPRAQRSPSARALHRPKARGCGSVQGRPAQPQARLLKHIRGSREASLLLIYICKSSCLANTDEERRDGKAEPILRCFLEARRGNLSAPRQQHRVQQLLLLWTLS